MSTRSAPLPTPENVATERLVAAGESAIGGLLEHLANIVANGPDAKSSVSDLIDSSSCEINSSENAHYFLPLGSKTHLSRTSTTVTSHNR